MNIHKALLKERSREQMLKIAHYIDSNPERFSLLMHEFLYEPYRSSQRAAYVITLCLESYPNLIKPWWPILMDCLNKPVHDAVIRNTFRIWQTINLPEKYHGKVYSIAISYCNEVKMAIAIRAHALSVAARLAIIYPELKNEVCDIARQLGMHDSSALKVRGLDVLRILKN